MAAKNVKAINWQLATNWQVMLREMNGQVAPLIASVRTSQGLLDKSIRKTGAEADALNYNLGKLKGRLRYWKSTVYEALSRFEYGAEGAPGYLTAAFGIVARVGDPELPPLIDYGVMNPDITRKTLAQLQEGFLYLRQAIANMREGISTGVTRTTAAAAAASAQRSPPSAAYNAPNWPKIPWWLLITGFLAYAYNRGRNGNR